MLRKSKKFVLLSLSVFALCASAQTFGEQYFVIAPKCLIKNLHTDYKILSSTMKFSFIEINENGINQLAEAKKANRSKGCGGFVDVTRDWTVYNTEQLKIRGTAKAFLIQHISAPRFIIDKKAEYKIRYEKEVNQLLTQTNPEMMWNNLTSLSNFHDRYSRGDNGVKAAEWLKTQIETLAKDSGHQDVNVYTVATGSYKQPSVVAKFGNSNEPGIVIGGHMDTLSGSNGKKPGADDDGTGAVTVLEVARTLLQSGMQFNKPIYFIWYAAEEMGLVGSGYVVADFKKKNIPVDAVIQFDMTGYAYQNDQTIWLMNDYVNKNLTAFLETLVNTYVKKPVKYTRCGYGCSDHVSWHQAGFFASMPFEAAMGHDDPYIHTSQDTMEILSLSHMHDFAKLATAFAVELAEPKA